MDRLVALGTILGDKYRIDRILGKGGMGVVAAATHVQLGTPVALRFLREQFSESAQVSERFLREARAAAQLRGEHVCRVFDVTILDGTPCLVMEMLEGIDLSKLLRRDGPFPVALACDYLLQACAGIAEAHAAKIIHRDLKPGNLFLTTRTDGSPLIKILDFGVAKAFADTDLDLTQSDVILGSPSYMSPEQIKSSRLVDARSDIWSLGVILYELVSGKKPFRGEGIANLAFKIGFDPTPPLPIGPAALDAVLARCLDKDPAKRYQDVAELASALSPFANAPDRTMASSIARVVRSGTTPPMGMAPLATAAPAVPSGPGRSDHPLAVPSSLDHPLATPDADAPSTIQSASGVAQPIPKPRPRSLWLFGAVVILVGAGIGAYAALGTEDERRAAAAPAAAVSPPPAPPVPVDAAPALEQDAAPVAEPAATPTPPPANPPARPKPKPRPHHDVSESRI